MADIKDPKAPRIRHARKSIAHLPNTDRSADKENATLDTAALSAFATDDKQTSKKSRSKSLGPGGLDALGESTGNRGLVSQHSFSDDELLAEQFALAFTTPGEIYPQTDNISIASQAHTTTHYPKHWFAKKE